MDTLSILSKRCSELETENEILHAKLREAERMIERQKSDKLMWRETCKDWKNSHDELLQATHTLIKKIGTPIQEEIKKHESIVVYV